MATPLRIPQPQARAFDRAIAERIGLDPTEIVDDFHTGFTTDGDDMTKVTFSGSVYLPTDEVVAMFNNAGRES